MTPGKWKLKQIVTLQDLYKLTDEEMDAIANEPTASGYITEGKRRYYKKSYRMLMKEKIQAERSKRQKITDL